MTNQPVKKGYKVFNKDFQCRGFQFKENTEYKHEGEIRICGAGFHFCEKASHCFSYYDFDPQNIVCEVEALGECQTHHEDSKVCTNYIKIGRRLTWQEVLIVANEGANNTGYGNSGNRNSGNWNSGNWNSGDQNSGDQNSGDQNSGNQNSGNWNSGNRNSGNWNSGNQNSGNQNSGNRNSGNWNSGNWNSGDQNSGYRNSGAFCTDEDPVIYLFNKPSKMTVKEWERSKAVGLMHQLNTNIWVESYQMSNEEKEKNPKWEKTGGYLKTISLKEAWANVWGNWSDENKLVFTSLPNFDAKIFKEITGIDVTAK